MGGIKKLQAVPLAIKINLKKGKSVAKVSHCLDFTITKILISQQVSVFDDKKLPTC